MRGEANDVRRLSGLSYEPLTPTSFLQRSAAVFGPRTAVVDGALRLTYAELWERARRLAGALAAAGVRAGDRVAVLAANGHMLLEATFGIPAAGAVMVPMNIRLSAAELAYILGHAEVSVLLHDDGLAGLARAAAHGSAIRLVSSGEYEALLGAADPLLVPVEDELSPLSINYTSGTTGRPKGVVYHHRGAYLQALAMALHTRLEASSAYLWTLPMFHCHGWCFPWAVTLAGARHVCLPKVEPEEAWRLIRAHRVTHLCGAPTVLTSLLAHDDAPTAASTAVPGPAPGPAPGAAPGPAPDPAPSPASDRAPGSVLDPRLLACVGGAPPSPALLRRALQAGIDVIHLYGLTETYGPAVICQPQPEWDGLDVEGLAAVTARQGLGNVIAQRVRVVGDDGGDVPADATTIGEIAVRGNDVMVGYHRDPEATEKAAPDGWFRTGDLGVVHPDGYVQLVDRAKDVIISGGENIASIEVENALVSHPGVQEAAVVARPDDHWGEVPVAYVSLAAGARATEAELIEHVRARLARFKAPKAVYFGELPKTSTGKIQKSVLRQRAAPPG